LHELIYRQLPEFGQALYAGMNPVGNPVCLFALCDAFDEVIKGTAVRNGISSQVDTVVLNFDGVRDKKAGYPLRRHFPETDFAL
jgi:hypothetical protein